MGLHALECMAGGSGVTARNSLRDFLYTVCTSAGFNAEKEQSHLLVDDRLLRPGDIFVPLWPGSGPVALNVVVTCLLQAAQLEASSQASLAAAGAYEDRKRNDRDSARQCLHHGVVLVVAESDGGWFQSAHDAIRTLAHHLGS